jgi:hypothetical protein
MPQFDLAQAVLQGPVLSPVPLLIDQQREALLKAQLGDSGLLGLGTKGLGHSEQAQAMQLLQGLLIQHAFSSL